MSDPSEEELVSSICPECGADLRFPRGQMQVCCSHCDAGMAVGDDLLIRLDCPVCRGNFYYLDGSMSGRCPYCEAELMALSRYRVLRLVFLPQIERPFDQAELRFLPFWRLSGLFYGWDVGRSIDRSVEAGADVGGEGGSQPLVFRNDSGPQKIFRGRVIAISMPDPQTLNAGVASLRLRASIFSTEPYQLKHEALGHFTPVSLGVEAARERLMTRAVSSQALDGLNTIECRRGDLVGETVSLLFFPFWIGVGEDGERKIVDAVNGAVEKALTSKVELEPASAPSIFDELKVIEAKCASCGAGLAKGNHSAVCPCERCGKFWVVAKDGLQPFTAHYAEPLRECHDPICWLPFWQLPVEVSYRGKQASRTGDLRNVLGVLGPRAEGASADPQAPLTFFAPAYGGMQAPRIDHAARDMTRCQAQMVEGERRTGEIFNCFFGPDDARRLGYVAWVQILPGTASTRLIRSLRLKVGDAVSLWYVPFGRKGREVTNLITNIRYDWISFRGVRH